MRHSLFLIFVRPTAVAAFALLSVASVASFAAAGDVAPPVPPRGPAAIAPPDTLTFCYADGKYYSEGWRVGNLVCAREVHTLRSTSEKDGGFEKTPLHWIEQARDDVGRKTVKK